MTATARNSLATIGGFLLLAALAAGAETVDIRVDLSADRLPAGWLATTGDWVVENGEVRQRNASVHPARLFFTTPVLADFEFSATFKIEPTGRAVRAADFLFRAVDTANYCYFHCNSRIDMVAFARATDASYWTLPERHRHAGVTPGTWHTARVVGRGDAFLFYLDGRMVARTTYTDRKTGCLGLGTCSARVAFKNIRIQGTPAKAAPPFRQGSSRYIPAAVAAGPGAPDWSPSLLTLPGHSVLLAYSTAIDGKAPRRGDIVIARSDDGGKNWVRCATLTTPDADERSPILRRRGAAIVCTWRTKAGRVRRAQSMDGGRSWKFVSTPAPNAIPVPERALLADARGLLAITPDGRVRRRPAGMKQELVSREPLWPGKNPCLARCRNGEVLLFLDCDRRGLHVFRSFDFGAAWQGPVILCAGAHGPVAATQSADGSVLVAYARRKPAALIVSRLDLRGPQVVPVPVGPPLPRTPAGTPRAWNGAMVVAPALARINPRNTEAAILRLEDGRLLLAYTRFYGGGGDFAPADISAMVSKDGGRSWGPPFLLQRNDAGCNVMSASLLRLQTGEILLGYLRKNGARDCRYYVRLSRDEGKTWSPEVCATPRPVGYYVVDNDRVIQLRTGRLLVPVADHSADRRNHRAWAVCCLSDDKGKTWRRGKGHVELPGLGCQEPGAVELEDGRVRMIIRTSLGSIYTALSNDGGETWTKPLSTGLASPVAPASIKRIPATGDLLLIWNHSKTARRIPLTAAVSTDEGETWTHFRDIETRGRSDAYTSICFIENTVVLSYWRGTADGLSLVVRRLPLGWFYGR